MTAKTTTIQVEKYIDGRRTITAQTPYPSKAAALRAFIDMQVTTERFYTGEAKRHANALSKWGFEMVRTRDGELIDYKLV